MTDVRILPHVRPEPPGTIAGALNADRLVVMGGPMGLGDVEHRSHLRAEIDLIEQALHDERLVLGACLGIQLLAHVLGAGVHSVPTKGIGEDEVTLTDAAADDLLFGKVVDSFMAFHWHGDVFSLQDGVVSPARSAQTEHQAFRYGDNAYGLLLHLEGTLKTVAWMTTAFQDELAEEGMDEAAIRRAAMGHEPQLRDTARTVFGRWAELVGQ